MYAEPNLLNEDEALPLDRLADFPLLADLHTWWSRHAPAPSHHKVDPLSFPSPLLSRLVLIDVEGPGAFRTRLAGTDVCKDRGRELRGLLLEDIHQQEELEAVAAPFRQVVETWKPDLRRRRYLTAALVDHCYVRLALPLSEDGDRVTGLLLASERVASATSGVPQRRVI